ncbi:Com family DNA-binding transcriptional regulator [Terasakiella sp. A23]|uniref:Com family DNA-binding transcriptional regulator n=1 Tax=Terasakiella sp. FCG-A23 TaxID=3080561 RepID=UPI0039860AE9
MENFRCGKCQKLLGKVGETAEVQIKCSRCGTLNHKKALEPHTLNAQEHPQQSVTHDKEHK